MMRKSRIRLDPVSCQSCRAKKLRCNRVQPCSNCAARGLACTFLVPPPQRQPESGSVTHNSTELLGRLERLESLLLSKNAAGNGLPATHLAPTPASGADNVVLSGAHEEQLRDMQSLHTQKDGDREMQLLANVGTREDGLLACLSKSPLAFVVRSTREIIKAQTRTQRSAFGSDWNESNDTVVTLPPYGTAVLLLANYEDAVDHVCRIVHIPTLRALVKTFYLRIGQNESVLPGQAALLLSMFALSAFFYNVSENSEVATTEREGAYLSRFWSQGALDVLDHSRRNTSGRLEEVQAYILMSYVTYHRDGFSTRARLLSTTAASLAIDLQLHQLDTDDVSSTEHETSVRALIDREVKRRVFWNVVTTDWLQSTISGPREGVYSIHPSHIDTKLPRDLNDDEIVLGEENKPVAGPQPTGMTFVLAKLRLAHLCRELTDSVPIKITRLLQVPYERILVQDQKFKDFFASLPFFFRLDAESREKARPLETVYPKIPLMRYCILTAAHTRRCRLHQKFLLRQSADRRYAYSRQACLESARTVIQLYEPRDSPGESGVAPATATACMGVTMHFTHLALVVMVMDLCFNGDEDGQEGRKAEVKTALQMLEGARDVSPLLGRSLDSLREVLHKNGVHLSDPVAQSVGCAAGLSQDAEPGSSILAHAVEPSPAQPEIGYQGLDVLTDAPFEEFWQLTTQNEMDLDSTTWDNVFSVLNSRPF